MTQTKLKIPPNDKAIQDAKREEERLISLILRRVDLLQQALDAGAKWDWFWNLECGEIFAKAAQYFVESKALLTYETVSSMMEKVIKDPAEVTRKLNLFTEIQFVRVDPDEFPYLLKQLTERQCQRLSWSVIDKYHSDFLQATNGLSKLSADFLSEHQAIEFPGKKAYNVTREEFPKVVDNVLQEIRDRREHPELYHGFKTGFRTIDDVFNGFQRQRSLVICAPEGGGKTTLMLTLADNMALNGATVAYVTVESKAKDLEMRLLARDSGIDFNRLMHGGTDEARGIPPYLMGIMEQRAAHRIETRKDRLRYITIDYDTPWTTVAKQIDYTRASTNIDVLVVDYLDCIGRISSNDGRPDLDLKDLFQAMVNYAKHNNLLLITAQQLKSEKVREIHKQVRAGKDIHASTGDVAGSKGVGAIADYMLLLMIDREKKRIQLRTMKARMAPSGDPFVLEYIPEKMLMTDPSGQRVYEPAERLVQENTIQQEEKEVYKEEGITPPEGHGSEVLAPEEERPWVE